MNQPLPGQVVICPNSSAKTKHAPESVYDGIEPNGKRVTRGIISAHSHDPKWLNQRKPCDWVGLPVEVVPDIKKD